jgi:hypothetical protein
VQLLREKLEYEQIVESELGKEFVDLLVTNFYNIGKQLKCDPDSVFFKNGNGNTKEQDNVTENGNDNGKIDLVSVATAIRRSSGKVAVPGMIIGVSTVVQMISETENRCAGCGAYLAQIKHSPPIVFRIFTAN